MGEELDANEPENMLIHLVMDNYVTHKIDKVKAWSVALPRYQVIFTLLRRFG